jgi:hypothetical protein
MLRDMRFIYGPWLVALVAFLQLLQGCDEDPVGELLASDGTDAANAGVFEVTRRPDGTIEIGIYGLKGVSQYQIFEFETDDVTGEMKETRQLRTLRHIPGQLEYRLETFDIPFGKNFCYQAKVEMAADNKVKDLGVIGCLQDNSAWYFKGIQKAQVDAAGRVVLSWDRIPSDGVTYEVFSKIGDGVKMSDRPMARITDAADYIDEVGENVFPRCYLVRANHQRCSAKDANEFSLCIDQSTYQAEMLSSPDAERPVFAGLKSISVSKSQTGLVNGVLAALGLSNSYSIQLTWDPASDNLTRIGRMVYHVYRVRTGSRGELNYSKPLAVTDSGALSYTDSSIEERVSYEYLVRAVDERGNMDVNEVWKEIPLDFEPPVFDGAVSAISERQSNSVQVRVSWARAFDNKTDPINIEYRIYRRPKGEPQFDLSAPLATRTGVASESISYVDTSVVRGGTYQYLVRAVDKDGNEDTNEAVVEVVASGLAPAFSGLKSVTRYGRNVDLRWAGATDDDSSQAEITYTVYRSEDELFGPSKVLGVTEPGATYFVDTSSDVDTTYN